jgi:hypothetical protein
VRTFLFFHRYLPALGPLRLPIYDHAKTRLDDETNQAMRMRTLTAVVALVLACADSAWATGVASTDRVGYTGTVRRFATLADALARTNPTSGPLTIPNRVTAPPYDTPYRDAAIFFVKDTPSFFSDYNFFGAAWYYSTSGGAFSGTGNPNNTNDGFTQIADDNGSTDTSFFTYFNRPLNEFTLEFSGVNATSALDVARLWNASGEPLTGGTFHTYQLQITFGGLNGAWNPSTGMYEASNHPTSVGGKFQAVFENTSAANSFYRVNWTFAMDNWAFGQGGSLVEGGIVDSFFASNLSLPEPGTLGLLICGFPLLAATRRRNRRRRSA